VATDNGDYDRTFAGNRSTARDEPRGRRDGRELRGLKPGVTATRCDASDMADEIPFRSYAHCDLYLLDGRDHCVRVTADPAVATGLIIAAKEQAVTTFLPLSDPDLLQAISKPCSKS